MSDIIYYIESEDRFSKLKSSEFADDKMINPVLALNVLLERVKELERMVVLLDRRTDK